MVKYSLDDDFDEVPSEEAVEELERGLEALFEPYERMNALAAELSPQVRTAARQADQATLRKLLEAQPAYVISQWLEVAMRDHDQCTFQAILESGFDPSEWTDPRDEDDTTLLMHAAAYGIPEMLAALLQAGADLQMVDRQGRTALAHAASQGQEANVRFLLERGASVDQEVYPAQLAAAEAGEARIFQLLQERATLTPDDEFWEALQEAQAALSANAARKARRAERVPSQDPVTRMFLEAVLLNKLPKAVRWLRQGADVNAYDQSHTTALHTAALLDQPDMVAMLLRHQANPNLRDAEDQTPLHAAASCGSISVGQLLLEAGGELDAVNECGETPLTIATAQGNVAMLQWLIAAGADLGGQLPGDFIGQAERISAEDHAGWEEFAHALKGRTQAFAPAVDATTSRQSAAEPAATARVPRRITVKPPRKPLRWQDPDEVDEISDQFRSLGFTPVGDFRINELRCRLRALLRTDQSSYAVIYEQEPYGVWCDIVQMRPDGGTFTVSNARFGGEQPTMPQHPKRCAPESEAAELFQQFQMEAPSGPGRPITPEMFPQDLENCYAQEIDWRQGRANAPE